MDTVETFLDKAEKPELERLLVCIEKKLGRQVAQAFPLDQEVYTLVEGKKYLRLEQLILVTNTFYAWYARANTPLQKMARVRIWLVFLLIRFGGLRLKEVLDLDETKAIDSIGSRIIVQGRYARNVSLPKTVMEEISHFLESSMYCSLKGKLFTLDQGYIRRKFYELAQLCDLPKNLLNPSILRTSRAIELLQGGVPSQVVQAFLGEQTLNFVTGYFAMPGETARRIVNEFLQKEAKMATSARNVFSGKITGIKKDGLLVEVELTTQAGLKVVSIITEESFTTLGLAEGTVATAMVKAPWVIIEEGRATNDSNCYSGHVSEVKTSKIAAEVLVALADNTEVCSLVTMESVDSLGLKKGKPVTVIFKAFSVILNVM